MEGIGVLVGRGWTETDQGLGMERDTIETGQGVRITKKKQQNGVI